MRHNLSLLIASAVSFAAGMAVVVGGGVLLGRLFPDPNVQVQGILRYSEAPDPNISVPPPEGYYVESTASERVYIGASDSAEQYLEQSIRAYGALTVICGPDGNPCFPKIKVEDLRVVQY